MTFDCKFRHRKFCTCGSEPPLSVLGRQSNLDVTPVQPILPATPSQRTPLAHCGRATWLPLCVCVCILFCFFCAQKTFPHTSTCTPASLSGHAGPSRLLAGPGARGPVPETMRTLSGRSSTSQSREDDDDDDDARPNRYRDSPTARTAQGEVGAAGSEFKLHTRGQWIRG